MEPLVSRLQRALLSFRDLGFHDRTGQPVLGTALVKSANGKAVDDILTPQGLNLAVVSSMARHPQASTKRSSDETHRGLHGIQGEKTN